MVINKITLNEIYNIKLIKNFTIIFLKNTYQLFIINFKCNKDMFLSIKHIKK